MAEINCWLAHSLERVFPASPSRAASTIELAAARNERVSFQVCVRNSGTKPVTLKARVDAAGLEVRIRRVGYVPVAHHNTETPAEELDGLGHLPGYAPDPLFPENVAVLGLRETHAFWVNVQVPAEAPARVYPLAVRLLADGEELPPLEVRLHVSTLVNQGRNGFPVTHWFYADALCDWYHVEPFDEGFWAIVQPYMRDLVLHGNSCQYVPIFTPPTDGIKRPTQLLRVATPAEGQCAFDFTDVRRWVRLAQQQGAEYLEWTHLFTQWGIRYALRIYRDNADRESLLWPPETAATSETYRNFLAQFLPAFHRFLLDEGLLERSFFHLSDEPHGDEHLEAYRRARALLRELAPWMRVMDALSDVRFGQQGLTDMPVPVISTAHEYREAGIPAWTYFCCGPRGRYLNRLIDTPLPKIRMSGWLFYRFEALGFLQWGYNYWYKSQTQQLIDPFQEQAALAWPGWAYGDPFLVYPGQDGPIDSLRWEVFADSLQDYALLQSAGIAPEDALLEELCGYADFPKTSTWILAARRRILGL